MSAHRRVGVRGKLLIEAVRVMHSEACEGSDNLMDDEPWQIHAWACYLSPSYIEPRSQATSSRDIYDQSACLMLCDEHLKHEMPVGVAMLKV